MHKCFLKIIAQIFSLTLCIYLIPSAHASYTIASGTCGADLTWTYESDNTLTISGTGKMHDYISSQSNAPWYSIRTYIKSVYIEGSVESIGYNAFKGYNALTRVIIEDGVSSIGAYSFANCSNLSKVVIPASVMNMSTTSFANYSELKCAGPINTGCNYEFGWTKTIPACALSSLNNLSSVIIPESVTNIGHSAFYDCSKLDNVIIPAGITSIKNTTFYGCSSLKSIILPDGITNIGDSAFSGCIGLENFRFPANLISLGEYAFYNCTGLINLTIPNGLENLAPHSFCSCQNLKTITIPGSVKYIGEEAFRHCKNLEWIALEGDMPTIESNAFNGEVRTTVLYSEAAAGYTPNKLQDYGGKLVWKLMNEFYYTVRYDPNGGTNAPEAQTGQFNKDLILPSDTPIRPDEIETYTISLDPNGGTVSPRTLFASSITEFEFTAWNTEQNGSGITYVPGDIYTENYDISLYALWDSKTETSAISLPTPTYEGHSFLGWSTSIYAEEVFTNYYTPKEDATLYALWDGKKDEPDFILPASISLIEEESFFGCAFRYVKLSENTVEIQKDAFSDCGNLKMIYIPESTRIIDTNAFNNVNHLIIIGKEGSYAETYAKEHGFDFSPMT